MHIALCCPVNLTDLKYLVGEGDSLPKGYLFPFTGDLAVEYLRLGCKVTIVTSSTETGESRRWTGENLTIVVVPQRTRARDLALTFFNREVRGIMNALLEESPDVVHAFWNYEFAHAAHKSKLPYFVTSEDAPWVIYKHFRDVYRFLRFCHAAWIFPRIRFNVSISPYLLEANRMFTRSKDVALIPNAVSDRWEPPDLREREGPPRIFIIGTWDVRKNTKAGINAFQLLRQHIPDAELFLIGGTSKPGGIAEAWCKENGLDEGIHFLGVKTSQQIMEELSKGRSILLHSSVEESFGMTLIEAMACGVPVVAGENSGAVPWVLGRGVAGKLCDVRNPQAIADALESILSKPEIYDEFSKAGIKRVNEEFRLGVVSKRYLDFANNVIREW